MNGIDIERTRLSPARYVLHRARRAFLRASAHQCPATGTVGFLVPGTGHDGSPLRAPIHTVSFTGRDLDGQPAMRVKATIPAGVTGQIGGRNQIESPDGTVVWMSAVHRPASYFGTKGAFAVWELAIDCPLEPDQGWASDDKARRNWAARTGPLSQGQEG